MANHPRIIKALEDLLKRMEDPEYLAGMAAEIDHKCTLAENEYDRTGLPPWSVGDMIAYGMDSDYEGRMTDDYYVGAYGRHGNGD